MGRSLLFYILRFCVEATAKLCFSFFSISLKILFLLLLSLEISSIGCSLLFHPILDVTSFQDGIESTRTEPATTTKTLYYTLKSAYCGILKVYAFFFSIGGQILERNFELLFIQRGRNISDNIRKRIQNHNCPKLFFK